MVIFPARVFFFSLACVRACIRVRRASVLGRLPPAADGVARVLGSVRRRWSPSPPPIAGHPQSLSSFSLLCVARGRILAPPPACFPPATTTVVHVRSNRRRRGGDRCRHRRSPAAVLTPVSSRCNLPYMPHAPSTSPSDHGAAVADVVNMRRR
jgi:hypothetical protein